MARQARTSDSATRAGPGSRFWTTSAHPTSPISVLTVRATAVVTAAGAPTAGSGGSWPRCSASSTPARPAGTGAPGRPAGRPHRSARRPPREPGPPAPQPNHVSWQRRAPLAGSPTSGHQRCHRHDPLQPTGVSCGPSDHAANTNSRTLPTVSTRDGPDTGQLVVLAAGSCTASTANMRIRSSASSSTAMDPSRRSRRRPVTVTAP